MNMNKNRKNNTSSRPTGPGNTNRSSPRSRAPTVEGVYSNSHFLHAAASQMGNNVRVQTKGGVVVEGIFRTFSEDFSIALEVPHRYQSGGEDKKINVETVQDNLIIKLCDIVTIQAKDVDLDYAVRDTFQTDTAISSRMNGARLTQKELVKWEGAENGDMGIGLELDTQTNGWDANEMFQLNEKEHGIRTTFKDNLETYTVQIDKKDSQFSQLSMEAERIANEIENNPATRDRLELENGDEEAAFASVVRPDETSEKMTTPPPAQSQKYIPQQQQQQPPKRNPDGRKMMPANSKPMYSKPMQAVVQQTINPTAGFKTMTINPPPQYTHQPPPTQYVHQEGGKINGDGREGNKSMQPRQMRMINPPMSFNEPPPPINQVSNQHMGKPPAMGIHMPPPHLPNVPEGQQTIHVVTPVMQPSAVVVTHAPPPTIHMHPVPQPQRPQRDPMMRGRNDEIRQLQGFHRDFQLGTAAPPPGQQQNVPPQVPNTQPPLQRPEMQDNGQNPMSHPPPIAIVDMGKGQQHPSGAGNNHHQQHIQHHPTPSSTPHSDKSHGPSSTPPQATPPPANSNNVNSSSGNSSESTPPATLVEKSTLNPKAKPFTLNPQAKPFTPRSPSTPNQSRPHTPQTPMAQQQQQQQQQSIQPPQQVYPPGGQLVFYCVQPQQRPTPPPMTVRNKQFQQFHVSQATGQPIFNPPVPQAHQVMQAFHPQAHQMQTVPSQSYPSAAIRMYQHEAQPQSHITSYLVPTPPSTTPSPGQPHQQAFHPGQQPSPAAGPPAQAFPAQGLAQGQYVMFMPSYAPQFVNSNQHNPQQLQVVMPAQQQLQQQHPAQ